MIAVIGFCYWLKGKRGGGILLLLEGRSTVTRGTEYCCQREGVLLLGRRTTVARGKDYSYQREGLLLLEGRTTVTRGKDYCCQREGLLLLEGRTTVTRGKDCCCYKEGLQFLEGRTALLEGRSTVTRGKDYCCQREGLLLLRVMATRTPFLLICSFTVLYIRPIDLRTLYNTFPNCLNPCITRTSYITRVPSLAGLSSGPCLIGR